MIAVVTGAATSLGLAIARRFQKAGATVYALDVNRDAVAALEPPLRGMVVDALDPAAVDAAFETILAESGGVDVLVNNVGLPGPRARFEDISLEDWHRTINGCVGAAFYCARRAVPPMKARGGGNIVNISTSSVKTSLPNRTPYVVAKAAVEALTANMARELGPFNIRVNAVRPGALDNPRLDRIIRTYATEKGMTVENAEADMLRYFSMRSRIDVAEVAEAVFFLTSPEAPHITGQCLAVDGNAEWEE